MTSRMLVCGATVSGSLITPLSYFLTCRTFLACISGLMFLWMIPIPPACAMAIARPASVTVSIAAETSGIFRLIAGVNSVRTETSPGRTEE